MNDIFEEFDSELNKEIDNLNKESNGKSYEESGLLRQGSKEWFKMRLGLFTGSKWPKLMTGGKGNSEWGETSYKLIREVFIERDLSEEGINLYIEEQFNKEFRQTKWGNKFESFARNEYSEITGNIVDETVFMIHSKYSWMGGSFDGEVEKHNKIIEIKCPYDILIHDHNFSLIDTGISQKHEYYPQIQCNIEVAGVYSCDFISFDPRRKRDRIAIINVPRDQEYIDKMILRGLISDKAIYYMNLGLCVCDAIILAENDYKS